jgi:hypothetical protein
MAWDAEMCKARAAEFRKKAAEATDPTAKDEFLRIAQRWDEALREIEAIEGEETPRPKLKS